MNQYIGGYPVCIVTTTGAKLGKARRIALIHFPLGESKLLAVSQGGMDRNPDWCFNVVLHPEVLIMVDGQESRYYAFRVSDQETARLWPYLLSMYPDFDEYQARMGRNIPVFRYDPMSG